MTSAPWVVYLDTSHLHLLATARESDPAGYAAFVAEWRALGCELALSVYHLLEMRVLAHEDTRAARYAVFADLAPVRLDVPIAEPPEPAPSLLTQREIVQAFVRHGMLSASADGGDALIASWINVFPGRLETAADAAALQVLEADIFGFASGLAKSALQVAARAKVRPSDQPLARRRLAELPTTPPTAEQHAEALTQGAAALDDPALTATFAEFLPPDAIEALKEASRGFMRAILDRQAVVGPQQAIAEFLDVATDKRTARRHLDTLRHHHAFESELHGVITRVFGITDPADRAEIAGGVTIADCPGTWLRGMIEIDLLKAEPAPPASTDYDLGHIGYLPHVDAMFADRRIVQYSKQVLAHVERPALLSADRVPRRAHTVSGVMEAIRRVATTASPDSA